jgi:hypothetical protein
MTVFYGINMPNPIAFFTAINVTNIANIFGGIWRKIYFHFYIIRKYKITPKSFSQKIKKNYRHKMKIIFLVTTP